ncbi:MAG: US12 family protein [Planctomyces sp.]|nr:US12 family protein [Planctomyces sp.]
MSYLADRADQDGFVVDAVLDERVAFIRRVYAHLLGAVLLFVAASAVIVKTGVLVGPMLNLIAAGQWWLILIAFLGGTWVAQRMAQSEAGPAVQYAGLGLYALLEAAIFAPLLTIISMRMNGPDLILQAGTVTLLIFGGLTAIVMLTRTDFSFLRNILWLGSLAALGLMVVSFFAGFSLGLLFVCGMIVLMSGYILYETSGVLHHFRTDQHVAASLALFASLATLFWYVLQLMSILDRD